MELQIDTSKNEIIRLAIWDGSKAVVDKEVQAKYSQAELLLPAIDEMLRQANLKLSDLDQISAADKGEGFTALRIGIITANALGYALGIPVKSLDKEAENAENGFSLVKPMYSKEPNIT